MGRGDKGSRKGKIFAGSFGNRRPHKHHKRNKPVAATTGRPIPKKAAAAR